MAHNISSKSLHIDNQISKIRITGGIDCSNKNQYPDLHVSGGARINKTLSVNGSIITKGNICSTRSITAKTISGNLQGQINGDLNVKNCLIIKGNLDGDLRVDGDQYLTGDFVLLGNINSELINTSRIVGDVYGNLLGSFNGTVSIDPVKLGNAIASAQQPFLLDATLMDAFGRQKVSNPFTLIDNKFLTSIEPEMWSSIQSGTATITFTAPSINLSVAASGDRAVRQSRLYVPYQPGKGLTALMTGTLETNGGTSTTTSKIGLFDDRNDKNSMLDTEYSGNGFFFQLSGNILSVVKRSFITGSQVDTVVPQNMWNVDKFDGTGPSKITIDPSKRQIFVIELEWLGVGTVLMGLFILRRLFIAHIFHHANVDGTQAYITRPSLPLRYEISTTGSAGSLRQICATVLSDGGYSPKGGIYVAPDTTGAGIPAITLNGSAGVDKPIISLRLKAGNKRTTLSLFKIIIAAVTGTDFRASVYRFLSPTTSPLTGAVWTSLSSYTAAEYDNSATAITFSGLYVKVDELFSTTDTTLEFTNLSDRLTSIVTADIAGYSDMIVITGRGKKNNGVDVISSIQWQELE